MRPRALSFVAWISRLFLVGVSLLWLAYLAFLLAGRLKDYTASGKLLMLLVPFAGALAFGYVALRVSPAGVVRVARELVLFAVALVAVETAIAIWSPDSPSPQLTRMRVAHKLGVPFDQRTKTEVTQELRQHGVDALPGISREWPQITAVRQQLPAELYPLSDASNASIVECNETGKYLVFHSDEFGFNNPAGLIAAGHVDVAAVGASFTLGHCQPPEDTLIGRLRKLYPRLANFGIAGGGTLAMLGSFREYVQPLRPPLVLWIMHPRTADTREELKDPILARYLDPGFSQHLMERRQEIDRAWRDIAIPAQYEFDRRSLFVIQESEDRRFARVPFLPQLRTRIALDAPLMRPAPGVPLTTFVHSLQLVDSTTRSWGGRLIVIIMPLYAEIVAHQLPPELHHDNLAKVVAGIGIPVIDAAAEFARQDDPAHLYTMRVNNHPNLEGYRVLAQFVETELARSSPVVAAR
jgi:hypothetical protein